MDVYVNAASIIPIDRYYEYDLYDLVVESFKNLEQQYDISSRGVDLIIVANAYSQKLNNNSLIGPKIAKKIGKSDTPSFRVENGDASGGAALLMGYSAIKSGMAKSVMIVGAEKQTDYPSKYFNEVLSTCLDEQMYYNGVTPHSIAAIMMKKYMSKYNVPREYFANWAIKMHQNAVENPLAYLRFAVDLNTILSSQIVSDPIRLFDIGARADGASIVVLSSEKTSESVKISKLESTQSKLDFSPSLPSIKMLKGKLEIKDVNRTLFEIHDSYSIIAAIMLEELGITEPGKSLYNLDNLNVNLSGGLKARGYPGGASAIYQLSEVYMQLLGTFKGKKMSDAERGIIISSDDLGLVGYGIELTR